MSGGIFLRKRRKGWIISIIIIFGIGGLISWKEQSLVKGTANILDNISNVDSISIIDSKSEKEVLVFSKKDIFFDEVTNVYESIFTLKRSERKGLLKNDPIIKARYLINTDVLFTISVFNVEDKYISLVPDSYPTEVGTHKYSYSPEGSNKVYIFVIEELNQLLVVNKNLEKLLNTVLTKIDN